MSTHNIGFYEDLIKIIFELASNIIKYAPYFFCCFMYCLKFINVISRIQMYENPSLKKKSVQFEPRCEKTGLRGFRPGPTQTGLYSHRRWLEA